MNAVVYLWIAAALAIGTTVILQWAMLRTKYRNDLTKQRTRHAQQQQTTSRHIEQAKQQIGQLHQDLAAARLQVRRLTVSVAASVQSRSQAKEALERTLDDASAARRSPTNGFADTLPSPHDMSLLFR